jgi:hypothetical protein
VQRLGRQTLRDGPIAVSPSGRWLLTQNGFEILLCPGLNERRPWIAFKVLGADADGHGGDEFCLSLGVACSPSGRHLAWGNNHGCVHVADLLFGPDGNLYVGGAVTDQIFRFNGDTGVSMGVFATAGGLDIPQGLAFTPQAAVPEPATFLLWSAGATGLVFVRRRKVKARG